MLIDQLSSISEDSSPVSLDMGAEEINLMRALVDEGNYKGVWDLSLELAEKNIFDIRILIYGIYYETIDDKLASLLDFYKTVNVLLDTAWHAVGPEVKRDNYAKTSFSWLFKQNLIDLQTHEVEQGSTWQKWLANYTTSDINQIISASEATRSSLSASLADGAGASLEKITELNNWLKDFIKLLPIPEQSVEEAPIKQDETAEVSEQAPSSAVGLGVTGSVHLDLLVQNMKVFERVIANGDLFKAAIVVTDINATLETFDPKLYFPDVFSQFYTTLVQHVNAITEVMEMQDSPQWTALNHLYHVDKNRFIDVEI